MANLALGEYDFDERAIKVTRFSGISDTNIVFSKNGNEITFPNVPAKEADVHAFRSARSQNEAPQLMVTAKILGTGFPDDGLQRNFFSLICEVETAQYVTPDGKFVRSIEPVEANSKVTILEKWR